MTPKVSSDSTFHSYCHLCKLQLMNSELLLHHTGLCKCFRLKLCFCVSESTIIAEQSTIVADSTLTGSDGTCPKHPVQTFSRVYCKDCEPVSTYCSSTKYTSSLRCSGPSEHEEQETPTIYCRDWSRKSRTGEATGQEGDRLFGRNLQHIRLMWNHITSFIPK